MSDNDNRRRNLERARADQEKEVAYRNEKIWKIFSWSSSLLVGSIAGAVAVGEIELAYFERFLICITVTALAVYTILWLRLNKKLCQNAEKKVKTIDDELGTYKDFNFNKGPKKEEYKHITFELTVALLAAISILMILLPYIKWFFICKEGLL